MKWISAYCNRCISLAVGILILGGVSSWNNVYAQDTSGDSEAETTGSSSLLPEINPQDIEIRSEYKAQFPGVRRQPILGFKPRARVFQLDPNRMPYMESVEEVIMNLPIGTLSRPDAPPYSAWSPPDPETLLLTASTSSAITPRLRLDWATKPERPPLYSINDSSALADVLKPWVGVMMDGFSEGNAEPYDEIQRSTGVGQVWIRKPFRNNLVWSTTLGGSHDVLEWISRPSDWLPPTAAEGKDMTEPVWRHQWSVLELETQLAKRRLDQQHWTLEIAGQIGSIAYEDAISTSLGSTLDRSVSKVDVAFAKQWLGGQPQDYWVMDVAGGWSTLGDQTLGLITTTGEFKRWLWGSTPFGLHAGVTLTQRTDNGSVLYPVGGLTLEHTFSRVFTVDASLRQEVEVQSVNQAFELAPTSPYLDILPPSANTFAHAALQFSFPWSTELALHGSSTLKRGTFLPVWTPVATPLNDGSVLSRHQWTSRKAWIHEASLSITQPLLIDRVWFRFAGGQRWSELLDNPSTLQSANLTVSKGEQIPLLADRWIRIHGYGVLMEGLVLEIEAQYEGETVTSVGTPIDGTWMMHSKLEFQIGESFGIFTKGVNLTSSRRLLVENIRSRPGEVTFGLRWTP